MKSVNSQLQAQSTDTGFEMVKISKAKETVDLCSNTIRSFFRQGLPKYQRGKSIFFSKSELAAFIRKGAA
jgi:hypothetical protein